ncbi:hypothetical protein CPJCM30710_07650 [Clostridium polyendosporum]|uniref:Protein GrpE n=1 Tax=Clostridium polyendosporum TaxID=69208 RepID=A0A919RYI1_9CLOT|nr:nucleotide exchange factor GrpE [Clostridium polyendosporum]GIM28099.1 hypothetical protein CPJCM30710_07650 [Clostridium polyendosporum]
MEEIKKDQLEQEKEELKQETNIDDLNDENNEGWQTGEALEDQEFEENEDETLKDELLKLKNENSKLSNELEALKDRLLRLNAEYDNFRKRTSKEKEGIYTDACEDVLKEMVPVLDNLERAITVEGSVEDLKKGIEMTIRQFKGAFEKLGVEEIDATGEFDPNLHQAVMHIQDEAFGQNAVAEIFQKGYKRGDKVLRYTMVKVAN